MLTVTANSSILIQRLVMNEFFVLKQSEALVFEVKGYVEANLKELEYND